jgi:hypothetical protein
MIYLPRYFVIKDGYLLYYPDTEKKDLEKRKCLNVHPKVAIIWVIN